MSPINTTLSAFSMPSLDDMMHIVRAFEELRKQGIERGVEAARGFRCGHGCAAAYTDKPNEGFVVCEHVVEELRKRFGQKSETASMVDRLVSLAIYTWDDWFGGIPIGKIAGHGSLGQLTWITMSMTFHLPSDLFVHGSANYGSAKIDEQHFRWKHRP